ncbi:uncharacterized protein LOC144605321 [Rhinoraja longicauda]
MAVTPSFKEQAEYLVNILLGEEDDDNDPSMGFRCLPPNSESAEEQAIKSIARCLRETGDLIDKEHLISFTSEFQTLAANHAMDQACELFSNTVNIIFQNLFKENEFAVEKKLLKISASLVMQTKKQIPSLIQEIGTAMINFIATPKLESWVMNSNGWTNIDIE